MKRIDRSIVLYSAVLFGFLLSCLNIALAADKEYLEAVEADVAEFSTKVFEVSPESPWIVSTAASTADNAAQSGGLEEFSAFIKSKSPGSFIFYKKLTDEYKQRLQQDYLATGDLDRVKDDIFRYTKEMKQSR
jgi:hypothetical protein